MKDLASRLTEWIDRERPLLPKRTRIAVHDPSDVRIWNADIKSAGAASILAAIDATEEQGKFEVRSLDAKGDRQCTFKVARGEAPKVEKPEAGAAQINGQLARLTADVVKGAQDLYEDGRKGLKDSCEYLSSQLDKERAENKSLREQLNSLWDRKEDSLDRAQKRDREAEEHRVRMRALSSAADNLAPLLPALAGALMGDASKFMKKKGGAALGPGSTSAAPMRAWAGTLSDAEIVALVVGAVDHLHECKDAQAILGTLTKEKKAALFAALTAMQDAATAKEGATNGAAS